MTKTGPIGPPVVGWRLPVKSWLGAGNSIKQRATEHPNAGRNPERDESKEKEAEVGNGEKTALGLMIVTQADDAYPRLSEASQNSFRLVWT